MNFTLAQKAFLVYYVSAATGGFLWKCNTKPSTDFKYFRQNQLQGYALAALADPFLLPLAGATTSVFLSCEFMIQQLSTNLSTDE